MESIIETNCGNCHKCLESKTTEHGIPLSMTRMLLCPICGNKRCPRATDHSLECTGDNSVNQKGSIYSNVNTVEAKNCL